VNIRSVIKYITLCIIHPSTWKYSSSLNPCSSCHSHTQWSVPPKITTNQQKEKRHGGEKKFEREEREKGRGREKGEKREGGEREGERGREREEREKVREKRVKNRESENREREVRRDDAYGTLLNEWWMRWNVS
jgi:hypothetical protein